MPRTSMKGKVFYDLTTGMGSICCIRLSIHPLMIFYPCTVSSKIFKEDRSISPQAAKDSQSIAQQVLKDPVLAKKLYQIQKRDGKLPSIEEAKRNPVDVGKLYCKRR